MHMASWCPGDDVYVYTWTAQESLCSSEWLRRKLVEMVLGDFEVWDRGTQDLWFINGFINVYQIVYINVYQCLSAHEKNYGYNLSARDQPLRQ